MQYNRPMTLPRPHPAVEAAALAPALAAALPPELADRAPALAAALAALAAGGGPAAAPLAPELKAALRALAGAEVEAATARVSFGSGNQFGDVTIGDIVGGDKLTVSVALPASRLSPRDQRNRRAMLARLRATWVDGLLARTFAEVGRAELALVAAGDAPARPLAALVQELGAPPLAPQRFAGAAAAFDAAGGALLILGAPGAGKTTLLVELARALLDRAEADEGAPIPVILPLSSWAARPRPLGEWLVDTLAAAYDVPRAAALAWREAEALLPLLDGLDEVEEAQRPACVAAINSFRAQSFAPLVVCSRADEYRALPEGLRLQLAVELQPLDAAGRAALLAGAGPGAARVADLLAADEALAELAANPLMLAVMARALGDEGAAVAAAPCPACGRALGPDEGRCPACGTASARGPGALRGRLVAAYVERVFARRDAALAMPRAQIEAALGWLAGRMLARRHPIFHLEDLQPDWLEPAGPLRAYRWLDRIGGALLAALACLALILPLSLLVGATVLPTDPWLIYPLLGALFGGVAVGGGQRATRRIVRDTLLGAGAGLLAGLILGLAGYFVDAQRRALFAVAELDPLRAALSAALTSGFSGALAGGLYGLLTGPPGLGPRRVVPIEHVRWSPARSLWAAPVGVALGAAVGGLVGLAGGVPFALIAVNLAGLVPADFGGEQAGGLWALASVVALTIALVGASLGALYGVVGGLAAGLLPGPITPIALPGAGLRRSLRSAMVGGLFFVVAGGLCGLALIGLAAAIISLVEQGAAIGWRFYAYAGVVFAVQVGCVGALCFGGFTLSSHLALRLVLWRAGLLPWRLAALLEEGAERALLRRVGGGYIFTHRIFLEHFAGKRDAPGATGPGKGPGRDGRAATTHRHASDLPERD